MQSLTGKLLTVKQVAERLGVHPRHVWRLASAGDIPRPIRIGVKSVRWRESDIAQFIETAPAA